MIDTNVVIYALENKLPSAGAAFLAKLPPVISDITRIELLGWPNATAEQLEPVKAFMAKATMVTITEAVILKTIQLKQTQKIKLGDAIIGATAWCMGLPLLLEIQTILKISLGLKWLTRLQYSKPTIILQVRENKTISD